MNGINLTKKPSLDKGQNDHSNFLKENWKPVGCLAFGVILVLQSFSGNSQQNMPVSKALPLSHQSSYIEQLKQQSEGNSNAFSTKELSTISDQQAEKVNQEFAVQLNKIFATQEELETPLIAAIARELQNKALIASEDVENPCNTYLACLLSFFQNTIEEGEALQKTRQQNNDTYRHLLDEMMLLYRRKAIVLAIYQQLVEPFVDEAFLESQAPDLAIATEKHLTSVREEIPFDKLPPGFYPRKEAVDASKLLVNQLIEFSDDAATNDLFECETRSDSSTNFADMSVGEEELCN